MLRQLSSQGSRQERAASREALKQYDALVTYMERREEIGAAAEALEPHRSEFDKLLQDENAYLQRTEALFAEERFAEMRFTAAEVRRALSKVRYVPNAGLTHEEISEKLLAAILFLADEQRRPKLAMQLWALLPEMLAAGRYLDGWIIQDCSYRTGERTDESNAFLFQMFSHGYDAWIAERDAGDAAVLGELGMDLERLRTMSLDEVDAWVQSLAADPAQNARLEKLLLENPRQRKEAVAGLQRLERDSIKILEREDAETLLLGPEEIAPWIPILEERWRDLFPAVSGGKSPSKKKMHGLMREQIWPTMGEMAKSFFAPERVQRLIEQLRKYRSERFEAGEKDVAGWAQGALVDLERETDPGENYFLKALCFHSISNYSRIMAAAETGPQTDNP